MSNESFHIAKEYNRQKKDMKTKFFGKALLMAASVFMLAACAGNAPCPSTDVPPQEGAQAGTQADASAQQAATPAANAGEPAVATPATSQPAATKTEKTQTATQPSQDHMGAFDSQALNTYRLNTPDNVPVSGDPSTGTRSESEPSLSAQAPDPYTAFPALAATIFAHADSLYAQGYVDSASAYLERLRIIKPLWNVWFTTADSMLNEFGKTRAEKAKEFEPLVFQIQNMNRAQAAYSMVAETADSLMALTPGDSLVKWAKGQKAIAYKNTLAKAKKEYDSIKALADNQAQFAIAQKKAEEFQMRYRDFEFDLHIQALIDYIAGLAAASNSEAAKYWESHDPAEALAKADELLKNSKFAEAKELLKKLMVSKLRKEANDKYQELANTFCNAQRKTTSQIFAKAQKQKDAEKKKKLLQDAIAPLEKCLAEYPEYSQKQKVVDNKSFLEKELAK